MRAAGRVAGPHRQPAGAELSAEVSSGLMGPDDDHDLRAGHQQNLNDWYWTDGNMLTTNYLYASLLYLRCPSPRGGHPRSVPPRVRQQRGHLVQPQVDLQRRGLHGAGHQVQDTA